jgi:alpha-1,2-glucosyltransferase
MRPRRAHNAPELNTRLSVPAATALVALSAGAALLACHGMPLWLDEYSHMRQIEFLRTGTNAHEPTLTTFETYHWIMATISRFFGSLGIDGLRAASTAFGFLVFPAALGLARTRYRDEASVRALQAWLLPVLFPYLFLVYTDGLSTAALLLAAWSSARRHHALAFACGAFAVAVRQTNVFWVFWLLAMEVSRDESWRTPGRLARSAAPYAIIGLAFAVFVAMNGGVALGSREQYPSFVASPNNLFVFVLASGLVMAPLLLARAGEVLALVRAQPATAGMAAALGIAFLFGYSARHEYNLLTTFVHNIAALWLNEVWHRAWLVLPLVFSALALCTAIERRADAWLLGAATVASLLPLSMIEQRYYAIPLALWVCLRKPAAAWIEAVQTAWLAILCAAAVGVVCCSDYFL